MNNRRISHKKLLQNIYKAAKYHSSHAHMNANDLNAPGWARQNSLGSSNAYAHIVQMVVAWDSIGSVDYHKVHKIKEELPAILK